MNKLVVFQGKDIRRKWFNDEWWFVIRDVVFALTDSKDPSQYLKRLRSRDTALNDVFKGGVQNVPPLGLEFDTPGGRQMFQCWNTKGVFRLIQSIPSKKAEPFKQWLAQVGYERVQEIENPELGQDRIKEYYKLKGYPQDWIEKRLRGITIRQGLTDEWKERGIKEQKDFSILTAEISKATFGMTPKEYKEHKNLPKESKTNLRDHMNDLELIFTMLGERVTTEISQNEKPNTFKKNKIVAKRGGKAAGNSRKVTEKELGHPVTTRKNYLSESEKKKKLSNKKG